MPGYNSESIENLIHTIAALRTPEECRAFLEDLCTIKELQDMAQRFDTAVLLSQGKNYQEISAQVGISTATISRVSRCLNYGSGGYRRAIENLAEAENGNQ